MAVDASDGSLRILRVSQWHYPEEVGGGAYHVHAMSRDQAALGHDVTVLTISGDDDKPRRETVEGYTVVRRRPLADPLGNELAPRLLSDLRRVNEYDVVHAHSHFYLATKFAAVASRVNDTPLAITNHGLYSQSAPERLFRLYLKSLGRWTLNSADTVFCYTDEEKRRLRDIGIETDVTVVANGIDYARFTPEGPESNLIESTAVPVILFVGRLVEGKRPNRALEAFVRFRATERDAQLYFCGNGPLQPELEEQAVEAGIEDAVHFLGHVSYDVMPGVYRAADVLILPSRAEGVPRTVLEALATGTPVVVSDLPQVRSLVDGAGYTVPVEDTDGFAAALEQVFVDPEHREELARRGRETVKREHSWDRTVARTTEALQRLTDGSGISK